MSTLTKPREFGSALDLLNDVDLGQFVIVTVYHKSEWGLNLTERVGIVAGTAESQAGDIDADLPFSSEIVKTTLFFTEGGSLTIEWSNSRAWLQVLE